MRPVGDVYRAARDFFSETTRHPVGFLGINLTSFSGALILVLLAMELAGIHGNPYIGIVTFLILPVLFILGLVLMPIGNHLRRKREAARESGTEPFPVFDLNRPRVRNRFVLFSIVTLVNLSIFALVAYKGIEFMDSVEFCGEVCHDVMHPELIAYGNSPHSRVRCVDCHIGPGASWYVKSKLSGTRQVFAAMLGTYPRPIPTPVHNLRPARETCEQCHWPQKFHGSQVEVYTHYQDDEANTPLRNVLTLRVGGGTRVAEGPSIHWHVNNRVEYLSGEDRESIYWVRAELSEGGTREYFRPNSPEAELMREVEVGALGRGETMTLSEMEERLPDSLHVRVMDCVDCHNRPTHIYLPAETALDNAMSEGKVPVSLPYIHREALAALKAEYPSKEAALAGIAEHLDTFYASEYPGILQESPGLVRAAVQGVQKLYHDNVFPSMNIRWGTYPNHIGHQESPGCFRCHDYEMESADGELISQDCSTCHTLLALEEENPEILQDLFPED